MSNPFIELDKMYREEIKKADEQNTADLYKESFCYLQKILKEEYHKELTNIEFLDGYFIFGTGTNSIVHFYVKGCKHWKFGIWWNYNPENKYQPLTGDCFCMHERYLGKFKPSRGTYSTKITFSADGIDYYSLSEFAMICDFIHKNPYLAAMKDFHYYDYNLVKQRPIKAFFKYYIDGFRKWLNDTVEDRLDIHMGKQLEYWGKKICEENEGYSYEIIDLKDYSSPRYELSIKIPDDDEQETGCFRLFDNDKDQKKWNKHCDRLEKLSQILGGYWYSSSGADDYVVFWKECEKEIKE